MAKGDHQRVENQVNQQGAYGQSGQNALTNNLYGANQGFQNAYNAGVGRNLTSYDDIMSGYGQMFNNPFGTDANGNALGGGGGGIPAPAMLSAERIGWDPQFRGALGKSIGTFGEFADTGGYSDQDKQDLRARAISPTRGIYARAQQELNRSRSLGGGSPNYAAAAARMARQGAQTIGDMNVNVNAQLAQDIAQNRLQGAQGLVSAGGTGQGLDTDINQFNSEMAFRAAQSNIANQMAAASAGSAAASRNSELEAATRLAALSGMTNLYGTTPELANVFGSQVLGSGQQLLGAQELQNQLGGQQIQGSLGMAQVPGNFGSFMGDVGQVLAPAAGIVGSFAGLGGRKPQPAAYNPYGYGA